MRRLTFKNPAGALEYTLIRRPRVTKRLHMELDQGGGLVIVAPRHWSRAYVSTILSQNTIRIERFLTTARQQRAEPLLYVDGALHYYLGNHYPLTIHHPAGRRSSVAFSEHEIRIGIGQQSARDAGMVLQSWYRERAMRVFSERLQVMAQKAAWAKDRSIPLAVRRMKRTWGNCSSKGVIKLNIHLIKAPLPMIDSVIAHELCHLEEMNHSRAFYALLESLNPDWRQYRTKLRSEGHKYLL